MSQLPTLILGMALAITAGVLAWLAVNWLWYRMQVNDVIAMAEHYKQEGI